MMTINRRRMLTMPITAVAAPVTGLCNVYVDWWWPVSHDDCIYVYQLYGSQPQCNPSKAVVERIVGDGANYPGFKEIRQLRFVSFPANPTDYL